MAGRQRVSERASYSRLAPCTVLVHRKLGVELIFVLVWMVAVRQTQRCDGCGVEAPPPPPTRSVRVGQLKSAPWGAELEEAHAL